MRPARAPFFREYVAGVINLKNAAAASGKKREEEEVYNIDICLSARVVEVVGAVIVYTIPTYTYPTNHFLQNINKV